MIPGFCDAMHCHPIDVFGSKRSIMFNLPNARPFFRYDGREARQAPGPVADVCSKTAKASVEGETAFQYSAKNIRIDISSTEWEHHFAASQFGNEPGQAGRQR